MLSSFDFIRFIEFKEVESYEAKGNYCRQRCHDCLSCMIERLVNNNKLNVNEYTLSNDGLLGLHK